MRNPLRVVMSSAELAGVEEIPMPRMFRVVTDRNRQAVVMFEPLKDSLYCRLCRRRDDCEHTGRTRLSGIITHTVTPDVLSRPTMEITK